MKKSLAIALTAVMAATAVAGVMDREPGIKIMGERMTLLPYVALSYTYDTNVDSTKAARSGSQWVVNPGMELKYKDDNWIVDALVWYKYHAYNNYSSQLNASSFGERLKWQWTNASEGGKGLTLMFSEQFEQIAQDDNLSSLGGRGMNRDRKQFQYEGLVNYRFNRLFHGALRSDYYFLDYDNNVSEYAWLYGWSRLQLGLEGGMTLSKWTDLLVSANYQWYWHDDNGDTSKQSAQGTASRRGKYIRGDSKGWSVMGGVATHMTEKLQYRLLAGWSRFEYGGGVSNLDGWTYQGSADWQIDAANTFHVMALASSYYQPSEREFGSALLVHNASFGVAKSFIKNKLKATADVAFRNETHEYTEYEADNYDENIWTARLTLSYRINRLLTVYGRVEYQTEESEGYYVRGGIYDYDRWRCTIGLRMTW
jgi:hypothetical protein